MFKNLEKKKIIIFIIAGIVGIFILIKIIDNNYQSKENITSNISILEKESEAKTEETEDEKIIIYITGEVKKEGVIELKVRKQNSRCNRKSRRTNRKCKHKKCKSSL